MAGLIVFFFALLSFESLCLAGPSPRVILYSANTYGPDGPWYAVNLHIGTPSQPIDLIPGGMWSSNVLTTTICANTTLSPVCYAQTAGLYNASASSTHVHSGSTGHVENGTISGTLAGTMEYGFDQVSFNVLEYRANVASFDMAQISEGYESLPDGTPYPLTIGKLGLGAQDFNQTWAQPNGLPNQNGTFLPSYLFADKQVSSNSYGMHVGSVALGIPGSLIIGGYDQSRLMGPISTQEYGYLNLPIDLLDIEFGIAEGQSPLSFASKSGYLAHGNTSIGFAVTVQLDASVPYMYLPQSTCDAIAQDLPVTFQPKYGLYFWNTSDPRYSMVSSPAYLGFTFRLNGGNSGNITINVPFALLNLTLTAPLTNMPTQYFPCRPTNDTYILGRAFWQAAFVAVNWQDTLKGAWFLAQAPGPNTPSTPTVTEIGNSDLTISSSNNSWLESWHGVWKAFGETTGNSTSPISTVTGTRNSATPTSSQSSSATSTGLSTGAVAGIGVGAAVACLTAAGLGLLFWRKSRSSSMKESKAASSAFSQDYYETSDIREKYKSAGWGPRELNHEREPVELGSRALPVEIGSKEPRHALVEIG